MLDVGITSNVPLEPPPTHSALARSPVLWVVFLPTLKNTYSHKKFMQCIRDRFFILGALNCHCVTSSLISGD